MAAWSVAFLFRIASSLLPHFPFRQLEGAASESPVLPRRRPGLPGCCFQAQSSACEPLVVETLRR